ncbi:MFS general substrate transporter [Sarocladium strictum]
MTGEQLSPEITAASTVIPVSNVMARTHTLGTVRHRDVDTNELVLNPTPSDDPNDPLNWSQGFKYYMAAVICLAMFMCNLVSAGPSVAIIETATTFFPDRDKTSLSHAIATVAYGFSGASLLQGTSNIIWMPLVNKYGRRPVYILSFSVYFAATTWAAFTKSYNSYLAARLLIGFGSGAAETLAPSSIADVFFLHERGAIMGWYTAALSCGVSGGMIIDGLITINHSWRTIYYVAIALVGATLLTISFTFPETKYERELVPDSDQASSNTDFQKAQEAMVEAQPSRTVLVKKKKKTYVQRLRIFSGVHTHESWFRLVVRPLALIVLPPVLWGALVMSGTIGFLVAVTSNVSPAFKAAYNFQTYQVGLCFFGAIIGSVIGIPAGGHLADWCVDYLARRNGGIREPEMRLPAIMISLITAPLSLILFGVGVHYKLHWIVPTLGLGLLNFSIAQATNVSLTYTIDAYRPIAGEITLTSMGFKSAFGFLLSFYTNPWVDQVGYVAAYGTMAAISFAVLMLWVPLYFWGKRIRLATWDWKVCQMLIQWDDDREVGE